MPHTYFNHYKLTCGINPFCTDKYTSKEKKMHHCKHTVDGNNASYRQTQAASVPTIKYFSPQVTDHKLDACLLVSVQQAGKARGKYC